MCGPRAFLGVCECLFALCINFLLPPQRSLPDDLLRRVGELVNMGNLQPAPPLPQPQDCGDHGTSPTAGVPSAEEETGSSAVFSTKNFMSNEIIGFLNYPIKRPANNEPNIKRGHGEVHNKLPIQKRTPSKEFFDRVANSSSFSRMVPPKKQEVEDDGEAIRKETDQAGCLFMQN